MLSDLRRSCAIESLLRSCAVVLAVVGTSSAIAVQIAGEPLQVPEEVKDDLVLVRRVIDARYFTIDGSPWKAAALPAADAPINWSGFQSASAMGLKEALQSDARRLSKVRSGDGMSNIVVREYGFGPTDSRPAYEAIVEKILKLNGRTSDQDIKEGELLEVPALPKVAKQEPSPYNYWNKAPRVSAYPGWPEVARTVELAHASPLYKTSPAVGGKLNPGSPVVFQYMWMSRKQAELELALSNISGRNTVAIPGEQITIKLAAAEDKSRKSAIPRLSSDEAASLQAMLAKPPKQRPVMVVLDDGWPDDQAYRDSVRWLLGAFKTIQTRYPAFPAITAMSAPTDTAKTSHPKATSHAGVIRTFLDEFEGLDSSYGPDSRRVRVIYLPLIRAQTNSQEVIQALVYFRLVHDMMQSSEFLDNPGPDNLKELQRNAALVVKKVSDKAAGDNGNQTFSSDKAIVEAVLTLLELHAEITKTSYVANFSWTTDNFRQRYASFAFHRGLVVAAAGNESAKECQRCTVDLAFDKSKACDCAENVLASKRWFAWRAADGMGRDVIAVMNTSKDGKLQCQSSIVADTSPIPPNAIGFDGGTEEGQCGTSFAAPRVAWLAAARLAYLDPKELPILEAARGVRLRSVLMDATHGGTGRARHGLDVKKLFAQP